MHPAVPRLSELIVVLAWPSVCGGICDVPALSLPTRDAEAATDPTNVANPNCNHNFSVRLSLASKSLYLRYPILEGH